MRRSLARSPSPAGVGGGQRVEKGIPDCRARIVRRRLEPHYRRFESDTDALCNANKHRILAGLDVCVAEFTTNKGTRENSRSVWLTIDSSSLPSINIYYITYSAVSRDPSTALVNCRSYYFSLHRKPDVPRNSYIHASTLLETTEHFNRLKFPCSKVKSASIE